MDQPASHHRGDIPRRVLLVGGSAVAVELGHFYARMGAQTTIVQRAETLVGREDARVGELARAALEADGVTVYTGRTIRRARRAGEAAVATLDDGTDIETDVVILGAGRRPRTDGLGLDQVGVQLDQPGAVTTQSRRHRRLRRHRRAPSTRTRRTASARNSAPVPSG